MHAAQRRMSALRKLACARARPKPLRSVALPESRRSRRREGSKAPVGEPPQPAMTRHW